MRETIYQDKSKVWPMPFRYTLTYQGVEQVLRRYPDTWDDFSLQWNMDKKYWNRTLTTSLPIKFCKSTGERIGGKEILDRAFANDGINADVLFEIEQFDFTTGVWKYKQLYKQPLDFSSYVGDMFFSEAGAIPVGLLTALAAKGDQEFEIPMDGATAVNYDRIEFNQYVKGISVPFSESNRDGDGSIKQFLPSITISDKSIVEVKGRTMIEFQSIAHAALSLDQIIANDLWFMKCNALKAGDTGVNVSVNINLQFNCTFPTGIRNPGTNDYLQMRIVDSKKNTIASSRTFNWTTFDGSSTWLSTAFGITDTFNAVVGEKYFVVCDMTFLVATNQIGNGTFELAAWTYRGAAKNINTLTPMQLGQRLLANATSGFDGSYTLESPILEQLDNATISVTSGDAIRGTANAKIKTTFEDWYEAYARLLQLGMDIVENEDGSQTAKIMPLSHFFQDVEVMNLGEVTEFRIKPYREVIPSTVRVGYKDNTYENSDGKGEFNTELEFATLAKMTNVVKDLMIPYRADSYGVEYVLIDFEEDETVDGGADNDVFLIKRSGNQIDRNISIEGTFSDETMFNGVLSPKQTLLRNSSLISSLLDKISNEVIFNSSKKDKDASIAYIPERRSETLGETKLFKPITFEFFTGLKNFNAYEVMRNNPNGYFSFSFEGKKYKGYVLELDVKPALNQKQDWKLLCHPSVEL